LTQLLQDTPFAGTVRSRRSDVDAAGARSRDGERRAPDAGVHVLEVFQPVHGGVPAYVEMIVPGLLAAGLRVSVACPPTAAAGQRLRALGVEVLEIEVERAPNPLADALAVRRLARFCRRHGVSLVHGHSTKAGMLAALAGARAGVPSLYTPHGWSFERHLAPPLRGAYALYERQMVRNFHAGVLTVSASGRRLAERWRVAPRGRVQVVRTGLPPIQAPSRASARLSLGLAASETVAAWVGRAGPQKRPEDLIALAKRLAGRIRVIALCQGAHGTALESELRAAGIVLAGPAHTAATLYAAADMMVQTSAWEAAPLAVLEAMRAGLPVVAYDVGGVGEQVNPGRTGYLVAFGDTGMLAECALSLARRPRLRRQMGEAGRRRQAEEFSYGDMVRQVAAAYLEFGARPHDAGPPRPVLAGDGERDRSARATRPPAREPAGSKRRRQGALA